MPRVTAEGVILSLKERGEADQLVTLLTPGEGPLRAVAKQAKWSVRRFGGRLGFLNRIHFDYSRKDPAAIAFLEETELIERFPGVPTNAVRFGRAMSLAEVIENAWGAGEPAESLYEFFIHYLRRADKGQMDEDRHYLEAFRLLEYLGHRPALDCCASCGDEPGKGWRYSAIEGGIVCAQCAARLEQKEERLPGIMKIRGETIRTLEAAYSMPPERLGRLKFTEQGRREAKAMWNAHIRVLLNRTPHSIEYLEKLEEAKLG